MSVQLRDYQLDAVGRLETGSILCGGVGSGKSRTSLAYYFTQQGGQLDPYAPMSTKAKDLYIITTARKRDTLEWEQELVPFLISTDAKKSDLNCVKVVIDSWNNISKYKDVVNAFFIFDEQRVVGSGAWVKSFLEIAKYNDWILLSATPGDTWSDYIPVFIANGFYRNKTDFSRQHIVYSQYAKFPKIDRYVGTGKLLRLRNQILVDMDFERKTVAHHEDVYVQYDISEYKDTMRTRSNPYKQICMPCGENDEGALTFGIDVLLEDVEDILIPGFVPEIGKTVKIINEPIVNASGLCYTLRRIVNTDESRQMALLSLFEKHPKMIIFYNFDYELEILKGIHYGDKVSIAEWNGHRHDMVPRDSDSWVYLVQYTAGAEGWNCITTDTTVFFSQNYSYKVMQQSAGRIDRLNTPFKDLYYYHLKSRSGIDLAISKALGQKKKFNESRWVKW